MLFTYISINIAYKPQVAYYNAQYFRDTLAGFESVNTEDSLFRYYRDVVSNLFYESETTIKDLEQSEHGVDLDIYDICPLNQNNTDQREGFSDCKLLNHVYTQQLVGKACFIQYRAALDTCKRPSYSSNLRCYPIFMNIDEYETAKIAAEGTEEIE